MPTRDLAPEGAPCWIDLQSSDAARAKSFYGDLLGWSVQEAGPEYGGYANFASGEHLVAGCMQADPSSGPADVWAVYLATSDVDALATRVGEHGGQTVVPPMDVMDLGRMAFFLDPGGAGIGAWQPGEHKGFGVLAEAWSPSWFELHTTSYDASVDFYRDVFGWDTHTMSDDPAFRYTTLFEGEAAAAGIMDRAGAEPAVDPHWAVYLGVDDTDAAVEKLTGLGGSLLDGPQDTPYGRVATVSDPMGATFQLVAS